VFCHKIFRKREFACACEKKATPPTPTILDLQVPALDRVADPDRGREEADGAPQVRAAVFPAAVVGELVLLAAVDVARAAPAFPVQACLVPRCAIRCVCY
jgi:hypothetical protein